MNIKQRNKKRRTFWFETKKQTRKVYELTIIKLELLYSQRHHKLSIWKLKLVSIRFPSAAKPSSTLKAIQKSINNESSMQTKARSIPVASRFQVWHVMHCRLQYFTWNHSNPPPPLFEQRRTFSSFHFVWFMFSYSYCRSFFFKSKS